MTPSDDLFQEDALDAQLDALARQMDQRPITPTSRAYHGVAQLYAPEAVREAQAIERVRHRLAPHAAQFATTHATPLGGGSEYEMEPMTEPEPPEALPGYVAHRWRHTRPPSRIRIFVRGIAAVLVVGFLLGSFLAVLHTRPAALWLAGYQFRVIPSPNTALAVNTLTGITVRNHDDAWAWGGSNVAPGPGSGVTSNPITQPLIEHWDGHHWRIVTTPPVPNGAQLADIAALAPDNAWVVGQQLTGGAENTSNAPLVEHWDGHQWTLVPDDVSSWPNPSGLAKLAALSATNIWAVGSAGDGALSGLIQHWDGRTWHIVAHPSPPGGVQFSGITALAPDDIWVAGTGNNGSNGAVFEHWDGRQWRIVPSPSPPSIGPLPLSSHIVLSAISAVSATDIWAAGLKNPAIPFPNGEEPLFEHWDGQRWSIVNGPSMEGRVADILAQGPNDVWAVGITGTGLDTAQQGQGLVEHWDGQQWSVIANLTPRPFTSLGGVASDPSTPGKLWIVGTTGPEKGMDQLSDTATLIETNQ